MTRQLRESARNATAAQLALARACAVGHVADLRLGVGERAVARACAVGLAVLAGCALEDPLHVEHTSCSQSLQTCDGSSDCFSRCVCEGDGADSCERECGASGAPRVGDLQESDWPHDAASFESEVLALTNTERAQGGCCGEEGCFDASAALQLDERLRRSARSHALDMATREYFDHDSPEGVSPFDRMREAGYRGCRLGENIAAGQQSPQEVVEGWRQSPGHCANMLQGGFRVLGVGYVHSDEGSLHDFWVQNFGG